jgi:hypothetical protein
LYPLLITLIDGALSFLPIPDSLNGTPRLLLITLVVIVGLTEMGHSIRVTGGLNRNVNGVINYVIQQNNVPKCLLLISLQIVQLPLNKKSQVAS